MPAFRRLAAALLIAWALGFLWFGMALPQPAGETRTDAVVVLTGGTGRVARGVEVLRGGWAERLFVSGVDKEVKPHEFALEYKVPSALMACCVTLGFQATDTRTNGVETGAWVRAQDVKSLRVVTNDWHMRRAVLDLRRHLPGDVKIVQDAVPTQPGWRTLFREYHKLLARRIAGLWEG